MLVFTRSADTWAGGYYELSVELGPPSDARLNAAVEAALDFPGWDGPYLRRDVEPEEQGRVERAAIRPAPDDEYRSCGFYAVAFLPDGQRVAAGFGAYRLDGEPRDWVSVYVPVGALGAVYPEVGPFPFGNGETCEPGAWERTLQDWLVAFGRRLYAAAPFPLGVTGFEMHGDYTADELRASGVPEERWDGLLLPDESGELVWYPPTIYAAQFTVGAGGAA